MIVNVGDSLVLTCSRNSFLIVHRDTGIILLHYNNITIICLSNGVCNAYMCEFLCQFSVKLTARDGNIEPVVAYLRTYKKAINEATASSQLFLL